MLKEGLVHYYKLNEGHPGPWVDTVAGANLVQSTGVAVGNRAGHFGNGVEFNGSVGPQQLQSSAALTHSTGMTVAAWIWLDSRAYINLICQKGNGWSFYGKDSGAGYKIQFASKGNSITVVSPTTLDLNKWYHVVGIYGGPDYSGHHDIWIDGIVNKEYQYHSHYPIPDNSGLCEIGFMTGGPTYNDFDGVVDEVAIWNRGLLPAEIVALYNNGIGLTCEEIQTYEPPPNTMMTIRS